MITSTTPRPDVLERLEAGVRQLVTTEAWTAWLRVQSRFHRYSFGNCLLIALQSPDATQVAGFRAWQQLGRQVRRGEKAISILAPIRRRRDAADEAADSTRVERIVGWRSASVFDIAQTDGEALPEQPTKLLTGDDCAAAWDALVAVVTGLECHLELTPASALAGANGDFSFSTRRIRVRDDVSAAQRVKTLAHELGHAILHGDTAAPVDLPRARKELEAESVAFVTCESFGIDSSDYTFGYVAGWAGGGDEAALAIRESGQRIHRAIGVILGNNHAEAAV